MVTDESECNMNLSALHESFLLFENREKLSEYVNDLCKHLNVPAEMIGGAAMTFYNYRRNTEDIDIITSVDDAHKIGDRLFENPEFRMPNKFKFSHKSSSMLINFCPTGIGTDSTGKHKFPEVQDKTPGLHVASLARLMVLKLQANRLKDRGDFAELVKRNKVAWEFIEKEVYPHLNEIEQRYCKILFKKAMSEQI